MKYNLELSKTHFQSIIQKYEILDSDRIKLCLPTLAVLYYKEGGKDDFVASEKVINVDCIDDVIVRQEQRKGVSTMDFAIIVDNEEHRRIVFADFKLKTEENSRLSGFKKDVSINKISKSTEMYSLGIPVFENKYFIFRKAVVAVAKSKIRRKFKSQSVGIIAVDIDLFYSRFFLNR